MKLNHEFSVFLGLQAKVTHCNLPVELLEQLVVGLEPLDELCPALGLKVLQTVRLLT